MTECKLELAAGRKVGAVGVAGHGHERVAHRTVARRCQPLGVSPAFMLCGREWALSR